MNKQAVIKKLFIASTDTVVGLGGPVSAEVQLALNQIKKRPENKPIAIIIDTITTAKKLAGDLWNDRCDKLAAKYWPGATTLIISDALAMRIPDCDLLREFIANNGPMYMTSANFSGEAPLAFAAAVKAFPEIKMHYNFCNNSSNHASMLLDVRTMKMVVR